MAIQYPINPETDRFTIYDTDTGSPLLDGKFLKWKERALTNVPS